MFNSFFDKYLVSSYIEKRAEVSGRWMCVQEWPKALPKRVVSIDEPFEKRVGRFFWERFVSPSLSKDGYGEIVLSDFLYGLFENVKCVNEMRIQFYTL